MSVKIVSMYKDALSRQVGEAMRIYFSTDVLLNSKSEYLTNCVSRLTISETEWEKKERERQEEMEENIEKVKVEKFRISKQRQQDAKKATTPIEHSNPQEVETQEKNKPKKHKSEDNDKKDDYDKRAEASHEEDLDDEKPADTPTNISIHEEECDHRAEASTYPNEASPNISTHEEDPGIKLHGLHRGAEVANRAKQKNKKKKDEYVLAWWNLWWKRMEREGAKDLNLMELERQNNASSSFLSRFLDNDSKQTSDKGKPPGPKETNGSDVRNSSWSNMKCRTDNMIMKRNLGNARHPDEKAGLDCPIVPANINGRGLKRGLSGNIGTLESPAKKSNTKFTNLLTFWGGQDRIMSCNPPPRSAEMSDAGVDQRKSKSSNPNTTKY